MSPKAAEDDDASLKRLAGQGWQTRDGRFTIETASGTWSLVDAEQTDDLGLPLVRGPFRSLTEAKAAIQEARTSGPATSDLVRRAAPSPAPAAAVTAKAQAPARASAKKEPEEPREPRWISELDAAGRRRAHRLIAQLTDRGVQDAEGVVRRDLAGDTAAVARVAVADQLAELLDDADPATTKAARALLRALVEGRDDGLDVRWRLVDDEGRPIGVSGEDVNAAQTRRSARH